ncbi:hypothetical protein BDR07DRAFT_1296303 [Suillus spraguei]|nr:hypothetical protein BDR07DRAFT_1296303 [Suillus spraguei]
MGQILNVLQYSIITKERRKDDNSRFWATYEKVSTEYDNDLVKQMHNDINIILTFGGLLSTVIATFIVGMQPNPGDTTNALLFQLIY